MNIKRLTRLNYLLTKQSSEESNLSKFIDSLSEENKEYFRSLSDEDKRLFEMLTPSELEQLGRQIEGSQFKYVSALKWLEFRRFLQERSLKSNPKLDLELTAYTPGETLSLLQNPKIVNWMQKIKEFKIPDQYKLIVLVPCAKTKPWGMTRPKKSDYYNAFNKLKEMAEKGEFSKSLLNTIYFVTISEPLGIVPQDHWDDFPQYDNPGLFKDPVMRSGLLTKDYAKSPIQTKHIIPFDKDAYDSAIGILGETIKAFLENNKSPGRLFVSFVEDSSGKIKTTHSDMLDRARIQDILPEENRFRKPSGQTSRKEDKKTPIQHYLQHLEDFSENQTTSTDQLLAKANVYYYLTKQAVPFDFLSTTSPEYGGYSENSQEIIQSTLGGQPLPKFKDFEEFFSKTKFKYRAVYAGSAFGTEIGEPISFDEFKNNILNFIEIYNNSDAENKEKLKEKYNEAKTILEKFDVLFKNDSINIIANKYEITDNINPMTLSHDLGHSINIVAIINSILAKEEILDSMIDGIMNDYHIKASKMLRNDKSQIVNLNFDPDTALDISSILVRYIIYKNNPVLGSISDINIKSVGSKKADFNVFLNDFIPDLMMYYHKGGESLADLKIENIKIEKSDPAFERIEKTIRRNIGSNYEILGIYPKKGSNNFNFVVNEILSTIEKYLNLIFSKLKGKIIVLWKNEIYK